MAIRMTITSVLMSIAVLFLFIWEMDKMGGPGNPEAVTYARTVAFCAFGLLQIFNAHNCRSYSRSLFSIGIFKNKYFLMNRNKFCFNISLFIKTESPAIKLINWTFFKNRKIRIFLDNCSCSIFNLLKLFSSSHMSIMFSFIYRKLHQTEGVMTVNAKMVGEDIH